MSRFADSLTESLERLGTQVLRRRAPYPRQARCAAALYGARWFGAPFGTPRRKAGVYHVVDHSLAHALTLLPARRSVLTCHDLIPMRAAVDDLGFVPGARARAQFAFSARHVTRAAALVAVSEATRNDMEEFLGIPGDRVEVIPLGVDRAFRVPPADVRGRRRDDRSWTDRFVIVQVGTAPYKNVGIALEVFAEVRRRGIDAVFVHIGAALDSASLRRVTMGPSTGGGSLVVQLPGLSDQLLAEVVSAADCLLFPSLWEGFGLPPLEAMACGTPVVTSSVPSLVEVCGDAALYSPAVDVRGLSDAVCAIAREPVVAERLRSAGLARATRYNWRACADRYQVVYDRVAGSGYQRREA